MVGVDDLEQALKRADRDIAGVIDRTVPSVALEAPLTDLYPILSEWHQALAVVDESGLMAGVVVKASVLEALARGIETPSEPASVGEAC
jgi:CBS-domain-containing membrane protein